MTGRLLTILLASYDTTANSFAWALWEASRQPDLQSRIATEGSRLSDNPNDNLEWSNSAIWTEADTGLIAISRKVDCPVLTMSPPLISMPTVAAGDQPPAFPGTEVIDRLEFTAAGQPFNVTLLGERAGEATSEPERNDR